MFAPALPFPRLPDFFRRERFEPRLPSIVRAYKCRDRVTGARTRNTDGTRNRATELTSCPPCPCACTTGCNTGTTVGAFTLVASGISFGTGQCVNHVGQAYKLVSAPSDMNGTFMLTQLVSPNCCAWEFAGSNSGSFDTYNDAFCTILSASGIAFTEQGWILSKSTNLWRLQRVFADSTSNTVSAFYATVTTSDPINCNPSTISFTSTNATIGANDPVGNLIIATGGSATVTFP